MEPRREQPEINELWAHGHMGEIWVSPAVASLLKKYSHTFCDRIFAGNRACSVPPNYAAALNPQHGFQGLCTLLCPPPLPPLHPHIARRSCLQFLSKTMFYFQLLPHTFVSVWNILTPFSFFLYHPPQISLAIIILRKPF